MTAAQDNNVRARPIRADRPRVADDVGDRSGVRRLIAIVDCHRQSLPGVTQYLYDYF